MKAFTSFIFLLLLAFRLCAQAPEQFSFQGVARNAGGQVVANKTVSIRLSVLKNTAFGEVIYRETHKPLTSSGGTFSLIVGTGTSDHGAFADINWKAASWFLRVEIDPSGGTTFVDMGTTQFLSVPYAIFSNQAAKAANAEKALTAEKADKALLADKATLSDKASIADLAIHVDSAKHAQTADIWTPNRPVVQTGTANQGVTLPNLGQGPNLIWYPKKAAFRAGAVESDEWNDANIGYASAAFNAATKASASYSFAAGSYSQATGSSAFAAGYKAKAIEASTVSIGNSTVASAYQAIAIGVQSQATGQNAIAIGTGAEAKGASSMSVGRLTVTNSPESFAFGMFNDNTDNPNDAKLLQRLFQIGNGTAGDKRSNALTILKNGNVGFGKNALFPQYILDIDGRPRLRNSGQTAGLYLNTSTQVPSTFIGMKQDDEVGFYLGNDWRFWVDDNGVGYLNGALIQKSDQRLKKDFKLLSHSLDNIFKIKGYNYFWKNKNMSPDIQTGLIAQEVETVFPELVSTDKEGIKAVNYIGFIPHLIEAVKELRSEVQSLVAQNKKLQNEIGDLRADAARLNQNDAITEIQKRVRELEEKLATQSPTPAAKVTSK